ncbi:M28 family peptidase [Mucilaginibacter daejeonensis]|uniref:M28 family peptidase n=1 Tax=Mucilaginibacter daejeonensis TaxID=398049 RepID=UPI001D174FD6|nr:M28 family peptidase [Mucilaginibacter daejeonensis]UEG53000.1 M28 family peptidase [Mucilaginibacter daejeonensis]
MKRTFLCGTALVAAFGAFAQKNPTAIKYAQVITVEDAKKQLTIVAADDMEGRETGKPGADKAANYLAGEYKKLGLLPANNGSYFLDVPLTNTIFTFKGLTVNGATLTYGKDYSSLGGSGTAALKTNEVVFVGYGSEAEIANVDVAGKIVMIIGEPKPGTPAPAPGTRVGFGASPTLRAKNPALILMVANVRPGMGGKVSERMTLKQANPRQVMNRALTLTINTATADQVLKASGKTYTDLKAAAAQGTATQTVKADIAADYETVAKDAKAVDIVAMIPGSDAKLKNEVLVFSAHYDHIGMMPEGTPGDRINNGADDDGSGTVGILEIARAFMKAKKDGKGPRRTILFLGNVGEEKGLLGSEWYSEHPVFPMANTVADLNIDMIGRRDPAHKDSPDYCYLIGSDKLSTTLHRISESANNTYTKLAIDYKYNDPNDPERIYYRSDHYNFAKHDVPIVFYFDGVHEDYHRVSDEVDKIDFPLMVKRAQLVFYTGWELANRNERPVVDVKNDMPATR